MGDNNWSRMEKLISVETIDAICNSFNALSLHQQQVFSVVLHGGEPLLLGGKRLEHILGRLREVLPEAYPISIQTNGVLISNKILDICSQYRTSIAVSIDGPKHVHDKFRKNHKGSGTFNEVLNGINILKAHQDSVFLNAGLLAVIDPESDASEVYKFFKELQAPSVDFLYKDGNHSNLPDGKSSIDSTEYGEWMARLLHVYIQDQSPLPIRVLDDMLKVVLGGTVSKEGLGLTDFGILIIDTDGTITKNDTLKSSYIGADRFSKDINIKSHNLIDFLTTNEFQEYRRFQRPTSAKCIQCPDLKLCGGGMILHRWKEENGFDNPSVYCADQLYLTQEMRKVVTSLVEQVV